MQGTLKITAPTYLKKSPLQSSKLPPSDLVSVEPGLSFKGNLIDIEQAHYKLRTEDGNQWFVYKEHAVFEQFLYKVGDRLPPVVDLPIPYFSQRNNEYHPEGTCNVTSVAMCLSYYGIKPKECEQLEDELYLQCEDHGWDRHAHDDLVKLFTFYGIHDEFDDEASWVKVKTHLANGNPVIFAGQLTRSGHVIVLRGYDEKGFFVNDPNGEWFEDGYQDKSGENLHYSYQLLQDASESGRDATWAHFPEDV